jgi:hypothetical protein
VQKALGRLAQPEPIDDWRGREPVQCAQTSRHPALGDRLVCWHGGGSYRYSL